MKIWVDVKNNQPFAYRVLTNSIKRDRISHAYLFQGATGTGKKALAKLFIKTLFCQEREDFNPCGECANCLRIESGNHPDVHWIKREGQHIKNEQIEYLQKEFSYSGLESKQKAYIIEDADTFTLNAANRMLKFLEEPQPYTTAIMLTENYQSIIPTIRSRCQRIDLRPLNPLSFQKKLTHAGISSEEAKLLSALTKDLSEAINLSEDKWFAQARKLMVQLMHTYIKSNQDLFLFIHEKWLPHFKDKEQLERGLDLLIVAFKDVLYSHIGYEQARVVFKDSNLKLSISQKQTISILKAMLKAKKKLHQNVHPTLVMEQLTLHIQR